MLKWSYHFKIWWAIWQPYCKDICKFPSDQTTIKQILRLRFCKKTRPRLSNDCLSMYGDFHYSLIFIMGTSILVRWHLYIKTDTWWQKILSKNALVFWTPNYFSNKRGSKRNSNGPFFIWYLNDIFLQITNHKSISRHNTDSYRHDSFNYALITAMNCWVLPSRQNSKHISGPLQDLHGFPSQSDKKCGFLILFSC